MFVDPGTTTTHIGSAASNRPKAVLTDSPEVTRVRLTPQPAGQSRPIYSQSGVGIGGVILPPASDRMGEEPGFRMIQVHAIIGASFFGCILLLVAGCALLQYCKKRRREQSALGSGVSPALADTAIGSHDLDPDSNTALPLAHGGQPQRRRSSQEGYVEESVDVAEAQQTPLRSGRDSSNSSSRDSSRSGSEDELSRLTNGYRDGSQPARYCIFDNSSPITTTATTATAAETTPAPVCIRKSPGSTALPDVGVAGQSPITPSAFDNVSLASTVTASNTLPPTPTTPGRIVLNDRDFSSRIVEPPCPNDKPSGSSCESDNNKMVTLDPCETDTNESTKENDVNQSVAARIAQYEEISISTTDQPSFRSSKLSESRAPPNHTSNPPAFVEHTQNTTGAVTSIESQPYPKRSQKNTPISSVKDATTTFTMPSRGKAPTPSDEGCPAAFTQMSTTGLTASAQTAAATDDGNDGAKNRTQHAESATLVGVAAAAKTTPGPSMTSPESDTGSEMSEFLASLILDVSPGDVTDSGEIVRQQQSEPDTDEESVHSDESMLRIQDVKAQAEFSPYHLAWSTPYPSQRKDLHKRQPKAAKKLDMELAAPLPTKQPIVHNKGTEDVRPEVRNDRKTDEEKDDLHSHSGSESSWLAGYNLSGVVSTSFTSMLRCYGLENLTGNSPENSGTAATPRHLPYPCSTKPDSKEVEGESGDALPYSVCEYRMSLKDVLARDRKTSSPKVSPDENWSPVSPASSTTSTSSPSIQTYPSSLQCGSATFKTPIATQGALVGRLDTAERWSDPEETPHVLMAMRGFRGLNNTEDDLEEFTDSSEGQHGGEAAASDPGYYCSGSYEDDIHSCRDDGVSSQSMPTSPTDSSLFPSSSSPRYAVEGFHTTASSGKSMSCESSSSVPPSEMMIVDNTSSFSQQTDHHSLYGNLPVKTDTRAEFQQQQCYSDGFDNFKTPFPVDNYPLPRRFSQKSSSSMGSEGSGGSSGSLLPRSLSETNRPLCQYTCDSEPFIESSPAARLRRSRTSDEISPHLQDRSTPAGSMLHHPHLVTLMSVGSTSDVSVGSRSASRLSLVWDHEFPAPGRGTNDSLAWEDDPCLE